MRWETDKSTSEHEVYHLKKDNKKLLSLTFNPFSKSARVECNSEKRVFLIRQEGFLRNKTAIRNEYGIKIGEFGHENGEYFIVVNDERFYYGIQNSPLAKLILYKESVEHPIVSCGLDTNGKNPDVQFTKDKNLAAMTHPGLLMALCWYMFLPVAKENVAEFAN